MNFNEKLSMKLKENNGEQEAMSMNSIKQYRSRMKAKFCFSYPFPLPDIGELRPKLPAKSKQLSNASASKDPVELRCVKMAVF